MTEVPVQHRGERAARLATTGVRQRGQEAHLEERVERPDIQSAQRETLSVTLTPGQLSGYTLCHTHPGQLPGYTLCHTHPGQ